jgi:hypothetical protein
VGAVACEATPISPTPTTLLAPRARRKSASKMLCGTAHGQNTGRVYCSHLQPLRTSFGPSTWKSIGRNAKSPGFATNGRDGRGQGCQCSYSVHAAPPARIVSIIATKSRFVASISSGVGGVHFGSTRVRSAMMSNCFRTCSTLRLKLVVNAVKHVPNHCSGGMRGLTPIQRRHDSNLEIDVGSALRVPIRPSNSARFRRLTG